MKLFFQNHELTKPNQDGKDGCKAEDPSRQGSAGLQTSTAHTEGLRNPQPDEKVSICTGMYSGIGLPTDIHSTHRRPTDIHSTHRRPSVCIQGSAGLQTSTTHTEGLRNPQPDEKVSICTGMYSGIGQPTDIHSTHRRPSKSSTR